MGEQNDNAPETKNGRGGLETIGDEEILARLVLLGDAALIDENNRLKEGALPRVQFQNQDGWSLLQMSRVPDIAAELAKWTAKTGYSYGYALVKAGDIRAIQDKTNQPAIQVIPDPLEDNPAHALAQRKKEYSKQEARTIRNKLLPKFSEVKTA